MIAARDRLLQNATRLVVDAAVIQPGRAIIVCVTVAGTLRLLMAGTTQLNLTLPIGVYFFDKVAVTGFTSAGTTATATVDVLS